MMKRLLLVPVLCAAAMPIGATSDCACDYTGHTFFAARPQFQTAMPEKITMMRDRMNAREDGYGGALELTMFGGQTNSQDGLRNFFFPHKDKYLTVSDVTEDLEKDLNSLEHFRVVTAGPSFFESTITICPRQSTFGIGLNWRENLSKWAKCNPESDYDWFFELSSPLTWIKNDLRFDENIINDNGGVAAPVAGLPEDYVFNANMEEAFKQKAWKYGKICGSRSKWGLADIEFKIGAVWKKGDKCHSEGYLGLLLPTGNTPKAEYVFEPVIGHNHHWGMISGSSSAFRVWTSKCDEQKYLQFTWDIQGMYLFERNECRSFDVKGHAWSRYMSVYANKEQAQQAQALHAAGNSDAALLLDSPGINYFTKNLNVKPGFSCNATTGIVYSNDCTGFRGEVGYNCYAREKECVKLACKWDEEVAFHSQRAGADDDYGRTIPYPYIEINDRGYTFKDNDGDNLTLDQSLAYYNNSIIQEKDLNMDSAAHPGYFAHTLYLSLAKRWEEREYPLYLSGGASYEYATTNAGLDRWLLWIKGGVSF